MTTSKNKLLFTAVFGIWLIVNLLLSLFMEVDKSSEEYPYNSSPSIEEIPGQEI